jgi:hypothetical protein
MQLLRLIHLQPASHVSQNAHAHVRASEHELPEKLFPQVDHGARLENSNDDFRILACQQRNFTERFAGSVRTEQGEFSVFLSLLQAELAFEQNPEAATGLIDVVKIGAGLGMDEFHRPQASKVFCGNAGEDRHLLQLGGKTGRLDLLYSRT